MTAPTFDRVDSLALYALSSRGDAGIPGYWAGYAPGPGSALPPQLTLDQAWRDPGGTYLFLDATPADLAAFRTRLDWVLSGMPGDVRLLWIGDVDAPPGNWQLSALQAEPTGAAWRLTRPERLGVGEYALELAAGTELVPLDDGMAAAAAGVAFAAPAVELEAADEWATLPLGGSNVGAWTAQLTLPAGRGDGLRKLGVEIRYAAPGRDGAPDEQVDVLRMSVMSQGEDELSFGLRFDPLFPLDPGRTRLGMAIASKGPALDATFRTSRGAATRLRALPLTSGLPPGGLVLCRTPLALAHDAPDTYHLTPDGAFGLDFGASTGLHRVMPGMSGTEYVAVPDGATAIALFEAGREAFAESAGLLTDRATTAYAAFLPAVSGGEGLDYFAQPAASPLFELDADEPLGAGFLPYFELAATRLPSWLKFLPVWAPAFPVAPYAGLLDVDAELARRLERAALAPKRRRVIGVDAAAPGPLATGTRKAVTPRGMMVEAEGSALEAIVLASMAAAPGGDLRLTAVGDALRGAVLTDQLFFVVASAEAYMGAVGGADAPASVPYCLDADGLTLAAARGVPTSVIELLRPDAGTVYESETEFLAAVADAGGTPYRDTLIAIAGGLRTSMSGWRFQLSPRSWRAAKVDPVTGKVTGEPTVMLFKFADRSLEALVEDTAAWGWPAAGKLPEQDSLGPTKELLRAIFERAREAPAGGADAHARFYRDVVADPAWNGVLFLNASVRADTLPSELQFVAAGIDPDRLYAHHVGFAATAIELTAATLGLAETAAFGLVVYDDPTDQVIERTVPFAFKTLSVAARFESSELAGFEARVELMVNRLFGSELTKLDPTHGNNLVLSGSYQRQGAVPSYAFALEGVNRYATFASMLDSIEVSDVRVLTGTGTATGGTVSVEFVLGGDLRFAEPPGFDPFCFGPTVLDDGTLVDGRLRFGGLGVSMSFPLATPSSQTFAASLDRVSFDPANSQARARSLAARFPVTVTGLVAAAAPADGASAGQTPADLGYASVAARIQQTPLRAPWFGLVYTIDLGTLGALAGSAGLTLSLLAAWMPGTDPYDLPAFVGLALPGGHGRGVTWKLQGVLELGARSIQFDTYDTATGRDYVLRLRRFALSALGISFPPGNVDLLLLPDDDGRALAWYAAYTGDGKPKEQRARSGRRVLVRGEG